MASPFRRQRRSPISEGAVVAVVAWLLALFCLPSAAHAEDGPLLRPFTAVYTVHRDDIGVIGENQRTLSTGKDGRYVYESVARATGWVAWMFKDEVVERSTWTYADSHIRPLEYIYDRSRGRTQRRVRLAFDWERKLVTNTIGKDAWRMPIPEGAQDKLVYQLSLMRDMQRPNRPSLTYRIADGGTLKTYQFAVLGEEDISTPLGKLRTIKIERINDKRDTTVWLAPRLQYLPVRIRQTDKDGSELSMQLKSLAGLTLK